MEETSQSAITPESDKKSSVLPWIAGIAAALLIGFLIAYFWLYRPASLSLAQTSADLAAAQSELSTTQADLEKTQTDLETAQGKITDNRFSQALISVQMNVAYTRLALATKDLLTARQEFSTAETNFADLKAQLSDDEVVSALEQRFKAIRTNLTSDSATALEELRTLSENLTRLEP